MEKRVVSISLVSDTLKEKIIKIKFDDTTMEDAKKLIDGLLSQQELFYKIINDISTISFVSDPKEADQTKLCISSFADFKEKLKDRASIFQDIIKTDAPLDSANEKAYLLKVILMDNYKKAGINFDRVLEYGIQKDGAQIVYNILASHYCRDGEEFLSYLLKDPKYSKQTILQWFNNQERFNLLNVLLTEQYDKISFWDTYILNNLPVVLEQFQKDLLTINIDAYQNNYSYPKLSKRKLHSLAMEFFDSIDETKELGKKYQKYHSDETIVYIDGNKNPYFEWATIGSQGNRRVIAPLKGDITDLWGLVHEVTHLITLEKGSLLTDSSLDEFAPISFEYKLLKFLKAKGYDEKAIHNIYLNREQTTLSNIKFLIPVLHFFGERKNHPITAETIKDNSVSSLSKLTNQGVSDLTKFKDIYPLEEENINIMCDQYNLRFLQSPDIVYRSSPYPICRNMAHKALERDENDPTFMPKLLKVVSNLRNESVESVIDKLDLNVETSKSKAVQKVKKDMEDNK